jgi:hypothetical protein
MANYEPEEDRNFDPWTRKKKINIMSHGAAVHLAKIVGGYKGIYGVRNEWILPLISITKKFNRLGFQTLAFR